MNLEGNPFTTTFTAVPGKRYRLTTVIAAGNGERFNYQVNGAVRESDGKEITGTLSKQQAIRINRVLKATSNRVDLYVRGEGYVKFWLDVGPTQFCGVGKS